MLRNGLRSLGSFRSPTPRARRGPAPGAPHPSCHIRARQGFVGLVVVPQGCGTTTRGTTEARVVESDPPGAEVELTTGHRCRTPCSIELKRKNGFVAEITRDGYETVEVVVTSQTAGAGAAAMAGVPEEITDGAGADPVGGGGRSALGRGGHRCRVRQRDTDFRDGITA